MAAMLISNSKPGGYLLLCLSFCIYHVSAQVKVSGTTADSSKTPVSAGTVKTLAAATVVSEGKIYEQKVDRFVFNVEKSTLANGSNGWEAISRTPGVTVNGNRLGLIGRGDVIVMVNDRRIQLSGDELFAYLSSIPTDNIATVEVVTSPGARYDASGAGGIIIIRLKKSKTEGLLLTGTATYEQRPSGPSESGNIAYNYKQKNLTIYGFANLGRKETSPVEYLNIYYPQSTWSSQTARDQVRRTGAIQFGLDLDLGKSNSISFVTDWNPHNTSTEEASGQTQIFAPASSIVDSVIELHNSIHTTTHYNNFDLSFRRTTDKNGSFYLFTLDYLNYDTKQVQTLDSYTDLKNVTGGVFNTFSNSPQTINNYSFKFDYQKNLPKKAGIGFGTKVVRSVTDNNYSLYISGDSAQPPSLDTGQSNHFNYTEDVLSAYVTINKTWKNSSLVIGLRGEQTDIKGKLITQDTINTQSYFKLFPSFSYMYVINKTNRLNLNYTQRITRPQFSDLNPFRYYYNEYSYKQGNPALLPSYIHTLELVYTYKDKYTARPFLLITDNFFIQVPIIDTATQVSNFTKQNIGTIISAGINLFIPVSITPWWTLNNTLYWFNYSMNVSYLNAPFRYNQSTSYAYLSNQFILSRRSGVTAEINGNYQSASQIFLNKYRPNGYVDCGLKWTFDQKRSTIAFNAFDLFHTFPQRFSTLFGSLDYNFYNKTETRYFRFSFVRKFGKQTVKDRHANRSGNAEEVHRVDN
jgi:hypothetical protein